jgi:hypothetical protein
VRFPGNSPSVPDGILLEKAEVRSYVIEELLPEHVRRLCLHLEREGYKGPIEDIYWFELPRELYTEAQHEHAGECGPYVLSLEAGGSWIKLELLVRARNRLRCSCIAYATPQQRARFIDWLDSVLRNLDIPA